MNILDFQPAKVYLYYCWFLKFSSNKLSIISKACGCHVEGSDGLDCNQHGICTCNPHVKGDKCDQCQDGYKSHPLCDECDVNFYGYPDCKACTCNENGSKSLSCNQETGDCECNENVKGKNCDSCQDGYFGFPDCLGIKI